MPRIGSLGAAGRMGRAIAEYAADGGATVSGGIDRDGAVLGGHADALSLARASDVLVDFSAPDALETNLTAAEGASIPVLVGTTGLQPQHHSRIDAATKSIAVLQAANTSLGVAVLAALVAQAAARLGPEWDVEVLEMHHRDKRDAPSGTALLLGSAAAKGRGSDWETLSRFERIGFAPAARDPGTIGYASLRGGSAPGDHQVIFAGEGERIELGHRVESRMVFVRGALKAAMWLSGKPAGRYAMKDVLGL